MSDPVTIAPPPPRAVVTAGAPVLAVRGIAKTWEGGAGSVLRGIDLELSPAEVVTISGANGAGKTTLLRILAGLILPDTGIVQVDGLDPRRNRADFHRRVGFLSAGNSGLYGRLKAEHHLEFVARLAFMPRSERAGAIARAVDAFELSPFMGRRVDRTSMGQRQRLRLALAFLHDPRVALLDEPATSLDSDGIALLQRALDSLRSRGGAAVVCVPTGWTGVTGDRHYELENGLLRDVAE